MTSVSDGLNLAHYPLIRRGKVRDVFDLGQHLLLVASDRVSAFDVVLPNVLPGKGELLTAISRFWFDRIQDIAPTQMTDIALDSLRLEPGELELIEGRSVIVRKADRVDIECVVRSYLAGSAWLEYQRSSSVAGIEHPTGMNRGDQLPEILFTPAIKNDSGHDENISVQQLVENVGADLASQLEDLSRRIFERGQTLAGRAGFLLADTKFEFGWIDGALSVIDEVLTPDSSRYWNAQDLTRGHEPPAYDKQIIRDWLEESGWNKQPPGPGLPDDIIERTLERYRSVSVRLHQTQPKGA
ncbi:MAG: phosphoribosylaminoimidazolesuccinocarboxamide synthase [Thermomicrobiales bacterium]